MGRLGVSAVLFGQGLACVGTVFPNAAWNRLLVVKRSLPLREPDYDIIVL